MHTRFHTWLESTALGRLVCGWLRVFGVAERLELPSKGQGAKDPNVVAMSSNTAALSGNISAMTTVSEAMSGDYSAMTAVSAAMSGNISPLQSDLAAMSGNISAMPGNSEVMSGSISVMTSNSAAMSEDISAMPANSALISGNISAMTSNTAAMSEVIYGVPSNTSAMSGVPSPSRRERFTRLPAIRALLAFIACLVSKLLKGLEPQWWSAMTPEERKAFNAMPFDELFCLEYQTLSTLQVWRKYQRRQKRVLRFRIDEPAERTVPVHSLPRLLFAILFVFACRLLSLFAPAIRHLLTGSLPLHGRAAGSACIARPPPFAASFWSVR